MGLFHRTMSRQILAVGAPMPAVSKVVLKELKAVHGDQKKVFSNLLQLPIAPERTKEAAEKRDRVYSSMDAAQAREGCVRCNSPRRRFDSFQRLTTRGNRGNADWFSRSSVSSVVRSCVLHQAC